MSSKRQLDSSNDQPPVKRSALDEVPQNLLPSPSQSSASTSINESSKSANQPKNIGGASTMAWFNVLCNDSRLTKVKDHLTAKLRPRPATINEIGCITSDNAMRGMGLDKTYQRLFEQLVPDGPKRFERYHVALLRANKAIPNHQPPPCPPALRQVKTARTKSAPQGNEKAATWVASHRCHNKECINVEHIEWEPSWFNRLRDNCLGGNFCLHRPHPCLVAHRPNASELIDWTSYIE